MSPREVDALIKTADELLTSARELAALARAGLDRLKAERSGDLAARAQVALDDHKQARTAAAARRGAHLRLVE